MKRILMLCLLLVVAFANVEAAKAAPLAFGAAGFDDQKTLLENLETLLPEGASGQDFMDVTPGTLYSLNPAYVALIGSSRRAMSSSWESSLWVRGEGGSTIADAFEMHQHWPPKKQQHELGDITVTWSDDFATTRALVDIIGGNVYGVSVAGAFYYGEQLVYQPDGYGYDAVYLSGGTIFIGLNFGWGNEVDAILAFSPAPINAVPVPAAVWLMGSGLAGIVALRRRVN